MPVAGDSRQELHLLEPDDDDYGPTELTAEQCRAALFAWYLMLAVIVCIIAIVLVLAVAVSAQAMTLNISAHVTGSGLMNSSYAGDWLNVSLLQNATGLDISVVGGAA